VEKCADQTSRQEAVDGLSPPKHTITPSQTQAPVSSKNILNALYTTKPPKKRTSHPVTLFW